MSNGESASAYKECLGTRICMSQKTAVPRQERLEENGFPSTYHEAGPHVGAYEATNR